jgi:hypothetical protein
MKRTVYIVGPTRSIGMSILHTLRNSKLPRTVLDAKRGTEIDAAAVRLSQDGLGIVAPHGSGKSVAFRRICLRIFPQGIKAGIINQENERNEYTNSCNVLVITPGIAMIFASTGIITRYDTVVFDEVHQTSVHLELAMALVKRIGCPVAWASATVDPSIYQDYFGTKTIIRCTAYIPERLAKITYQPHINPARYLSENIRDIAVRERGVAVFVPTQAEAEKLAKRFNGQHGVFVDHYHGGTPIEKLDRFIKGPNPRPYVIIMTSVGASGLNIVGLDTVVIVDRMYSDVVRDGKVINKLTPLSSSMLKQMLGRTEGRAIGGEAVILTDVPNRNVRELPSETPNFLLGGDLETLALISAKIGVDARKLSLIGNPDLSKYRSVLQSLVTRGLITVEGGIPKLTKSGKRVERMPIGVAWGEIVDRAIAEKAKVRVNGWMQTVCMTACTERLYAVTMKDVWQKAEDQLVVWGSDHLTAYNIVTEALRLFGSKSGNKYKLGAKVFYDWCFEKGYSPRGIQNVVQQYVSLMRRLEIELPEIKTFVIVKADDVLHMCFLNLLASVQSMDYVPKVPKGKLATHANENGVTDGSSILGTIRYHDRKGSRLATIDGTQIPDDLVIRYSRETPVKIVEPPANGRALVKHSLSFAEHPIDGEAIRFVSLDDLPPELVASVA